MMTTIAIDTKTPILDQMRMHETARTPSQTTDMNAAPNIHCGLATTFAIVAKIEMHIAATNKAPARLRWAKAQMSAIEERTARKP